MRRIVVSVSVCLFVCPLAYLSQKPQSTFIFTTFSVSVAVARSSSDGSAIYAVHVSCFVDDVMLLYNGANRPESKTTCVFRTVRHVAAPGGKVCFRRLHLVIGPVLFCLLASVVVVCSRL